MTYRGASLAWRHVENLLNFIGGGSFEMSFGTDELPSKVEPVPLSPTAH